MIHNWLSHRLADVCVHVFRGNGVIFIKQDVKLWFHFYRNLLLPVQMQSEHNLKDACLPCSAFCGFSSAFYPVIFALGLSQNFQNNNAWSCVCVWMQYYWVITLFVTKIFRQCFMEMDMCTQSLHFRTVTVFVILSLHSSDSSTDF